MPRFQDWDEAMSNWWVDPELEKQLEAARKDPAATMDPGEKNNYYWRAWHEAQAKLQAEAPKEEPAAGDAEGEGAEADGPADAEHAAKGGE